MKMLSISRGHGQRLKKLYHVMNNSVTRTFLNLGDEGAYSMKLYYSSDCYVMKIFSNSPVHTDFPKLYYFRFPNSAGIFPNVHHLKLRSMYSDATSEMLHSLTYHGDFSKKLNYTDKYLTQEVNELVVEWLSRFHSLGPGDANSIAGAFNGLSKMDIFDIIWSKDEKENFKTLIIKLTEQGNKLIDPKNEAIAQFSSWQIAICLNVLCKWDVLKNNFWEGTVKINGQEVKTVRLFESFITRLIDQGNRLLDMKKSGIDEFTSQSIANCLYAVSKWDINELKGSRQLVERLIRKNPTAEKFTSMSISRSLNAMSKWDSDELQGCNEFIVHLMKQGARMTHEFKPQEISNSFNALSRWENIENLKDSRLFIIRLVRQGSVTVNKFSCQDIAICLNALSKWNVHKIEGAMEFINRLVKRGSVTAGGLKPQEVSICFNALSKWNIEEIQGSKEFIVQLIKCGNYTVMKFNPQIIANSLNALSKWNMSEFPDATEFIVQMIKRGSQTYNLFNAQCIANSLTALSKWNIEDLSGAREFINRLIKRGNSTKAGFTAQGVAGCLNALSKWSIDEFEGAKEFIVELTKRGASVSDHFDSKNIANSLNALSKWNIEELPKAKEFISRLVKKGSSLSGQFDSLAISNCLNALSKWNIDEFQGSKNFIVQLARSGITTNDELNYQKIGSSLNSLSKFDIFDDEKWFDYQLKIIKQFIIKLATNGEELWEKFDSQNVSNIFNAFWTFDILNDRKWTKTEQNQLKSFIVMLSTVDEAPKNYILESIFITYTALLNWDVFNNDKFDSYEKKIFKQLVNNLENRIFTIADTQDLAEPSSAVKFASNIIKDVHYYNSKNLISKDNKLLIHLMKCLCIGVEKCDTSLLISREKDILSALLAVNTAVAKSMDRSSMKGAFDESLCKILDKLVSLDVSYVDRVFEIINTFDEFGIIKHPELQKKLK